MRDRCRAARGVLVIGTAISSIAPLTAGGQARSAAPGTPPRTAWGDPDFDGIWNYATMTPLERPAALAGKDVLTVEEAAAYERQIIERQGVTNNTAGLIQGVVGVVAVVVLFIWNRRAGWLRAIGAISSRALSIDAPRRHLRTVRP